MGMIFPVTAELEEEEMEIVTGDITKVADEEEVVTATITQEDAMMMEKAMKVVTITTETIPEIVKNIPEKEDIVDTTKISTALST
jgi:uncharacterized cupin superfamily protein